MLRRKIYFQTVSHIEYLVHFAPVRIALLLDGPEQRRNGEKVVFDNAAVISDKVQHFGLRTAGAVYHTVNFGTERIEQFLNHRRICTGGREHQLSGIQRTAFHAVCQFQLSAVYQFVGYGFVIAFRIFLRQIFGEYVVAGAGKPVAAHTAVILFFVSGLSARGEAYNHVSRTDIGIVDNIRTLHAAGYRRVNDDGTHQVAHIGGLATGGIYAYTHFAEFGKQFVRTVDDGGNHFSGHKQLVASDGA